MKGWPNYLYQKSPDIIQKRKLKHKAIHYTYPMEAISLAIEDRFCGVPSISTAINNFILTECKFRANKSQFLFAFFLKKTH